MKCIRLREEAIRWDKSVLKELFNTNISIGLYDYLDAMSLSTVDLEVDDFVRLLTVPEEIQKEIDSLFNYRTYLPWTAQYLNFTAPDFENIDQKPFKTICDGNPLFVNYCQLEKQNFGLTEIFKLMKYATHPKQYTNNLMELNYKHYRPSLTKTPENVSFIPMCWFGSDSGLYLSGRDIPVGDAYFFLNLEMTKLEHQQYYKVSSIIHQTTNYISTTRTSSKKI